MPTSKMIPAAALAILFRVNLAISVALVWITNPITMPPVYYFTYRVGAWILQRPPKNIAFKISWEWLAAEIGNFWQPFLLGSLVTASVCALAGYLAMRALWRWHVIREWQRRKNKRAAQANQKP